MAQEICVTIYDSKSLSKEIKEAVNCNKNWTAYRAALKKVQQNVNHALTEIVEKEKLENSQIDNEDGETSEDEADVEMKRKADSLLCSETRKSKKR